MGMFLLAGAVPIDIGERNGNVPHHGEVRRNLQRVDMLPVQLVVPREDAHVPENMNWKLFACLDVFAVSRCRFGFQLSFRRNEYEIYFGFQVKIL